MIRTAVIGVGYLGRFHAQKYKALASENLCQFVGIYDASYGRAQMVAAELGVEAFESVDELLKVTDAVAIATNTQTHFETAKKALSLGIHTNVEKPMTVTGEEAEELLKLASAKDLVLGVGHSERYNPVFQHLKKKYPQPDFLELRRHATFKLRGSDVSVVLDLMIHDLDLALKWLGPLEVKSAMGGKIHSVSLDWAECELRAADGTPVLISTNRTASAMTRAIRGVDGLCTFNGNLQTMEVEEMHWVKGEEQPKEKLNHTLDKQDHLMVETRAFLAAIGGDRKDLISGNEGAAALKLALEIEAKVMGK